MVLVTNKELIRGTFRSTWSNILGTSKNLYNHSFYKTPVTTTRFTDLWIDVVGGLGAFVAHSYDGVVPLCSFFVWHVNFNNHAHVYGFEIR